MKQIEKSGRTVEEAIELALIDLDLTKDEIEYEVIEKESRGLLGIFGSRDARVRVWKKEVDKTPVQFEKTIVEEPQEKVTPVQEISEKIVDDSELSKKITKYLQDLTFQIGVDATVKVESNEDNFEADISGEGMAILIGKRGKTLDAIQYLTNLAMNREPDYKHILIDTENYREKRKKALENLAHRMADKAKKQRRDIMLNPMNAYERRIVHSALSKDRKVSTRSEGKDPYRKIIIFLNR